MYKLYTFTVVRYNINYDITIEQVYAASHSLDCISKQALLQIKLFITFTNMSKSYIKITVLSIIQKKYVYFRCFIFFA